MDSRTGRLDTSPATERPHLLAPAVGGALANIPDALVAEIDPACADTAALCEAYGPPLSTSANCVAVTGRRAGGLRHAACVVLATTRADVNGLVRRRLDARKASFASAEFATEATGMEYGGITPVGLPADWPVLVDAAVAAAPAVVIGSGVRHSKLALPGELIARLAGAEVVESLGR